MRIVLRRLPDGTIATERVVVRVEDRVPRYAFRVEVQKVEVPSVTRSLLDHLLGEKGRALVARITPRFNWTK